MSAYPARLLPALFGALAALLAGCASEGPEVTRPESDRLPGFQVVDRGTAAPEADRDGSYRFPDYTGIVLEPRVEGGDSATLTVEGRWSPSPYVAQPQLTAWIYTGGELKTGFKVNVYPLAGRRDVEVTLHETPEDAWICDPQTLQSDAPAEGPLALTVVAQRRPRPRVRVWAAASAEGEPAVDTRGAQNCYLERAATLPDGRRVGLTLAGVRLSSVSLSAK